MPLLLHIAGRYDCRIRVKQTMKTVIKEFIERTVVVSFSNEPSTIEAFISLTSLWWGVILLLAHNGRVDYLFSEHVLALLNKHGGYDFWISAFFVVGIGLLVSKGFNLNKAEEYIVLISVGMFGFMSAAIGKISVLSFPFGVYTLLTFAAMWTYTRLRFLHGYR